MAKRSKGKKGKSTKLPIPLVEASPTAPPFWKPWLLGLVLVVATFWIYWPSLRGGWLWDDDIYVTDNSLLRDLAGLYKIWFQPGAFRDYYPLDSTVAWIQWHLWQMATPGYHLTNVILHIVSSLLVWRLLAQFHLKLAWLGGLLFAIHPIQVESVAWIAELKNTLSLPFFLGAMIFWIDYEEHHRRRDYLLALGLFLVAMLGKPTMAAFPFTLLLYAWWKRGRIEWRDVKVSAPFYAVSLILGLATVWYTQRDQPHISAEEIVVMEGFLPRVIVSGLELPFVLSKVFLPLDLMPIYPGWSLDSSSLAQLLSWPILAIVIIYLWTKRKSWGRHALLGLGFFLAMAAPVFGFVATNYSTMTWSMDHLQYLPMIGLVGLVVAGLELLARHMPSSLHLPGIALLSLLAAWLAWESHGYAQIYTDKEALLNYTLKSNPQAWPANYNLGLVMMQTNRVEQAIDQFQQALKICPYYPMSYDSLGNALVLAGRAPEAEKQYAQALNLYPDYAEAHFNLGDLLKQTGRLSEAAEQYQAALKLNPRLFKAHYNLGNILLEAGRPDEAIEQYQKALEINPDYAEAHYNMGNALIKLGRAADAAEQFQAALKIKPDDAEAHYALGNALYVTGHAPEAIEQFEQAVKLNPGLAAAHYNLGYALMQSGDTKRAMEEFQQTLNINPDDAGARTNLEKLNALQASNSARNSSRSQRSGVNDTEH